MTNLNDAKKSDWTTGIAMIAGGKAHRVTTRTLLEDATYEEQFLGRTRTKTIAAGETLYYGTACGTRRNAKWGMSYQNHYAPTEEITCTKCLAKEAPAEEAPVVVVKTGSKKTLITVNGEEVAYVANQFAEAAEAMVRASL
jgi:cytochrome c biogenesis protein ResB